MIKSMEKVHKKPILKVRKKICITCGADDNKFIEDTKFGEIICTGCGTIQKDRMIHDGPEWSNYENDREKGIDNSRVSWTDPTNPYSTLGSTMPDFFVKIKNEKGETITVNLKKVHTIISSDNKERAFYEIIKLFNSFVYNRSFEQRTVDKAKLYWNEFVKSKRIFRGGNRKGILACCLYYASIETNKQKTKNQIARIMNISKDDIVKGEPIFIDIIIKSKYKHILSSNNNVFFTNFISELELPYKYNISCKEIYSLCQEELSEISSSAAIGGVISYFVHIKQKLKKPTKKRITQVVKITNPTLTNAVKIIKNKLES